MCGRYTLTELPDESKIIFEEGQPQHLQPRFNIAPSNYCPIVPLADAQHIYLYRWGLVPSWARDEKIGYKMINARAETLDQKASFKRPLASSRCLVLADGFYEWKREKDHKQPYRITLQQPGIFSMAGLTDHWQGPDGKDLYTFTIITTEANEFMQPIHDRMPAILDRKEARAWLNPALSVQDARSLLRPYDPDKMQAYPVSNAVGNVRNDTRDLIQEIKG